ncbi:MAG: acetyltransferase [Chitinophagaceae bacterium]
MVVVYGASGHAKEISFFLRKQQVKVDFVVDRNPPSGSKLFDIEVIDEALFAERFSKTSAIHFYVAIGDMQLRRKIVQGIRQIFSDSVFPNLVASEGIPDFDEALSFMGEGNIFFPGTRLTTHIRLGSHNHFNQGVSVSHDVVIEDYNTFSPGARIAGTCSIGSGTFWGVNAVAIDKVSVADHCVIGAGAVITRTITEPGTYAGVPARKIK